jgi:hypothetical protein
MTIFGKVLIIFNVLAATVFVYVASVDWAARYKWAYAVYRDDLALKGLPLDGREEDHLYNIPLEDKLGDGTLKQIFSSFGPPVRTQVEEVEKLKARVMEELNAAGDEPAKRKKWIEILSPLANNLIERDAILARASDPKVTWSDLERDLSDLFAEAQRPDADDGKTPPPPSVARPLLIQMLPRDRRRAIAHLLFNIHPKNDEASVEADHLRLQVVIGLNAFTEEAKHQGEAMRAMVDQADLLILGDRAGFEVDHKLGIDELRDRYETIGVRRLELQAQQKLRDDHAKLKEDREKDVVKAKDDVQKARKATSATLQVQAREENVLFKAQRFVGEAKELNEKLERQIKALEKTVK